MYFGIYDPLKVYSTTLRELRFRFGRRELDNSFTNLISKSVLETQSKSSSADLRYNRDTGQLLSLNRFKLIKDRYKFSNFDLINDVSPIRDDIYDGVSPKKFIYNPILNKIVLNQSTQSEQPVVNTEVTSQPQGKLMSNLSINAVIDKNKEALITATKLEVGNIAINLISEQLIKLMPPPLQFIINDNPLLKILIANAANLIIVQTSVNDPRLLAINEAMLTASYVQTLETFDFKSIVDGILRDIPADKLNALVNSNN